MALTNVTLLASTQGEISVTGEPVRASGSIRAVGSLYTVVIYPLSFVGRVYIEGTLATNPSAEDWFPIILPGQTTNYVEFSQPSSAQMGFNFKGSFTWIRARQDRDYLALDALTTQQLAAYGSLDKIVLNMGTWSADQTLTTTGPSFAAIDSVKGNNLGVGAKLYANTVGQSTVLLNFKTLLQGNGIAITEDPSSITITNTGTGSGGTSGVDSFTALNDTPDEIVNNGILVGGLFGSLLFVTPPTATSQVLSYTGNGVEWAIPSYVNPTVKVNDEGTLISNATTINFVGAGVTVTNGGPGVATVTIGDTSGSIGLDSEYVEFLYTAGNAGNFNAVDVLASSSTGVTATVIDAVNCVVQFTFAGRLFPPSSIALMGQAYATNEFNYSNVTSALPTRKLQSGGTSAAPTLMGAFTGPVTLQLRMADTGASAGAGQRARAIVIFKF